MDNLKTFTDKFHPLEKEELAMIGALFVPVTIKKMDHLIAEGDYVKDIFFIDNGLFRSYGIKDGEEYTTGFFYGPLMFAEIFSIRKNSPTMINVQALKENHCFKARFSELEALIELHPNIKKVFYKLYEMLYLYGVKRQQSFVYDSQKERYEKMIREFPKLLDDIPLQYIASYLGLKPETLSRIRKSRS